MACRATAAGRGMGDRVRAAATILQCWKHVETVPCLSGEGVDVDEDEIIGPAKCCPVAAAQRQCVWPATPQPPLPPPPREVLEMRSCSEFQRNLTSKTRQIPKASADKSWNVASKAGGEKGKKKKCRSFSAATTCTLGACFFSHRPKEPFSLGHRGQS